MYEQLSDEDLERRLEGLVGQERAGLAEFLSALIEIERRKLALGRAYGSTFEYCRSKLRLSEDEAYKRIQAARAAKDHPEVLDVVREGRLSLTAVTRLAPHLKGKSSDQLINDCFGKTIREIEEIVAKRFGTPVRPADIIRPIALAPKTADPPRKEDITGLPLFQAGSPAATAASPADASELPVEEGYRLHVTVGKAFYGKLQRAIDLSRHRRPDGGLEQVLEDALDSLLADIDRSLKPKPAPEREVLPDRRRIPEWVKDVVWKRDGGACAFEAEGRRCGATAWIEYDHVKPFSEGGPSDDPSNIRLLCRRHNQWRAASLTTAPAASSVEG